MKATFGWMLGVVALAGCSSPTPGGDAGDAAGADAADAGSDGATCQGSTAVPSPRGDAVGVVDPETGALWISGGDVGPTVNCRTQPEHDGEVWRFEPECGRWERVAIENGPSPRARAAAALDARRRRMLVFGGRFRVAGSMGAYTLYNEVWALDLAARAWERVQTSGAAPTPRANSAAVYDAEADELVVYGGNTSTSGLSFTPQGDAWALNLETRAWRRITATGTAPRPRLFHATALRGRRMLVLGGGGADAFTGPFYDDAFVLDLASATWSRLALGADPEGRINHAVVNDPRASRWLLLAGHDDGDLGNRNDVLAIADDGALSTLVAGDAFNRAGSGFCDFPADFATADMEAPERRSAFVTAVDERRGRVLVFGGKTDCGTTNDVWSVDLATGRWRPLRTSNEGVSCARAGRAGCSSLCN